MFLPAQPIYPVAGIRDIEARVMPDAKPSLMERAGRAAAEDAVRLIIDRPGPILVACGPGNNGGDGFVLARHFRQAGREVVTVFADDAAALPPDAAKALADWHAAGGQTVAALPPTPADGWALVVDALFGIGLTRPIVGRHAEWIATLNGQRAPRLALDIPSGLDADTGRVLGACFRATHTTTFIALKPGLLTLDGPDYAGEVSVQRLEVDAAAWLKPQGHAVRPSLFARHLVARRRNSHKGCYGDAAILGGAPGMGGAALLAARAALWLGAGRVFAGLIDPQAPTLDPSRPELMLRPADELPAQLTALAIGPGLGQSGRAAAALTQAIAREIPLVLDADALNLLAADPHLQHAVLTRSAPTILTPHPAEAGRLLGCDTAAVQADRVSAARALATRYRAHTVLKGCGSVIASTDGNWYINGTGHPGMASAGMGDVLSGLIVALLAQGWPAAQALIAAVHLHGAAGDRLAREGIGPIGLSASEVIDAARGIFNAWIIEANRDGG
ncbi:NAD(P)H-hydrate dehydratase [Zoogloeaceae bacteirum Par-f-2]|uniref:NAD(P)H-hydrate dehydratase n=1 Tax=Pseudothauera hydrothermalis TaxID=2184083 RepID=UPI000C7C2BB9|nr:NAD(P)H-hydrate dehydratase [Pseudothauera hydrothermalis]AUL99655.1 bifunctional ADP-dependent (S)-NAD(P)H-hydrate dehydratase/NAD(P)H-hydrate epimerase [Rhodocyclaceae bacterium]AVZ78866.1 NAD(P)H-hydrate dehydratase [Zoogloeaceae bacteirum Par-f-2]